MGYAIQQQDRFIIGSIGANFDSLNFNSVSTTGNTQQPTIT